MSAGEVFTETRVAESHEVTENAVTTVYRAARHYGSSASYSLIARLCKFYSSKGYGQFPSQGIVRPLRSTPLPPARLRNSRRLSNFGFKYT